MLQTTMTTNITTQKNATADNNNDDHQKNQDNVNVTTSNDVDTTTTTTITTSITNANANADSTSIEKQQQATVVVVPPPPLDLMAKNQQLSADDIGMTTSVVKLEAKNKIKFLMDKTDEILQIKSEPEPVATDDGIPTGTTSIVLEEQSSSKTNGVKNEEQQQQQQQKRHEEAFETNLEGANNHSETIVGIKEEPQQKPKEAQQQQKEQQDKQHESSMLENTTASIGTHHSEAGNAKSGEQQQQQQQSQDGGNETKNTIFNSICDTSSPVKLEVKQETIEDTEINKLESTKESSQKPRRSGRARRSVKVEIIQSEFQPELNNIPKSKKAKGAKKKKLVENVTPADQEEIEDVVNNTISSSVSPLPNKSSKKRGRPKGSTSRKKKKVIEDVESNNDDDNMFSAEISTVTCSEQPSTQSPSVKPKGKAKAKGRRKKKNITEDDESNIDATCNPDPTVTYPEPPNTECPQSPITKPKGKGKGKGRKKKKTIIEDDESNIDTTCNPDPTVTYPEQPITERPQSPVVKPKTKAKANSRNKKKSVVNDDENNIDTTCSPDASSNSNISEQSSTVELASSKSTQSSSSKRRGKQNKPSPQNGSNHSRKRPSRKAAQDAATNIYFMSKKSLNDDDFEDDEEIEVSEKVNVKEEDISGPCQDQKESVENNEVSKPPKMEDMEEEDGNKNHDIPKKKKQRRNSNPNDSSAEKTESKSIEDKDLSQQSTDPLKDEIIISHKRRSNPTRIYTPGSTGNDGTKIVQRPKPNYTDEKEDEENIEDEDQTIFELEDDPNDLYVEESAWKYHDPPYPKELEGVLGGVAPEDLKPLPPAPSPPELPSTGFCKWSFDEGARVLHADFRQQEQRFICPEDLKFLLKMYERDDITVISEGLVTGLDEEKWTLEYLESVNGDEFYHKFRKFERIEEDPKSPYYNADQKGSILGGIKPKADNRKRKASTKSVKKEDKPNESCDDQFVFVKHREMDKNISMKISDFVKYLRQRSAAFEKAESIKESEIETTLEGEDSKSYRLFSFQDDEGLAHEIDVLNVVLYMIDYDMVKLLPSLYADFVECFKIPGTLPGGSYCMMNNINVNGRPFMGPNFYVTPPASYTHFHQDGNGTVDSGHYCMNGYNEVVMLRRMTERHKKHALSLLTGAYKGEECEYDPMYNLPHGDSLGEKPKWPTFDAIEECRKMNYYPSVFILKPGQLVHINKGRLHAFRKLSSNPVPNDDCHFALRSELLKTGATAELCISIAWDWMYRGVTTEGINREVVSALECAALNRINGVNTLAITESSLLQMARKLAPPLRNSGSDGVLQSSMIKSQEKTIINGATTKQNISASTIVSNVDICRGIYPGLQFTVKQHVDAIGRAKSNENKSLKKNEKLSIAKKPNSWENPQSFSLDPYGNSDFFCRICYKELSNIYLHCDGCEIILCKDFNICVDCHTELRFCKFIQMHPLNKKRHSTINHLGDPKFDRQARCACKNGPVCKHCGWCAGCSCRCHTWFTMHYRFYTEGDELKLLKRVEQVIQEEDRRAADEAEQRLSRLVPQVEKNTEEEDLKSKDSKEDDVEMMDNDANKLELANEESSRLESEVASSRPLRSRSRG